MQTLDIQPHQKDLFSGLEATNSNLRSLFAAPGIASARTLINDAMAEIVDLDRAAEKLAALNVSDPGILTRALVSNSALAQQVGAAYGTFVPWIAAVSPLDCSLVSKYVCNEKSESWRDSLAPASGAITLLHINQFVNDIQQTNTQFKDNPKIHLESAEVVENALVIETRPAWYSDNAAISHYLGNRLYALSNPDGRDEVADQKPIKEVLSLLSRLGITPGTSGIDISLGSSRLPHTLGISGMVLTSDGYVIRAKQGEKNMASGGDIVPAISGSADPSSLSTHNAAFSPLEDFLREGGEEQSESQFAYCAVAGIYQSLHRLGKPDIFLIAVLKSTAQELYARQASNEKDPNRWELSKQIATATYLGQSNVGLNHDLGDEARIADLGARITTDENPKIEAGMRYGNASIQLDKAAVNELMHVIRSERANHVDRVALIAGLEHVSLCADSLK